jgi:UDP-N-acetylmuramoyl-tripeptide--D-alanyl-D-alanine ligase
MKSFKIKILERILCIMAKSILWRQKPFIIGITGSVGKTTTKDMIAHILSDHKRIWVTQKNYNNEIGVPLTILCVEKNINSLIGIFHIMNKWLHAFFTRNYPEIVVVEMGVDRPGDMDYLMSIVSPDIAILTAVQHAHSEFFRSVKDIANEKQKIVTKMKKSGKAIINTDDHNVRSVEKKTSAYIISYGTNPPVDFLASDIEVCFGQHDLTGLSFKLNYKGRVVPVRLQNVIAQHMIYAALAALAVADTLQINIVETIRSITDFVSSPGRMRLLQGKNDVLLIDDTYNASPSAMGAAIITLANAPAVRKIAILGDMRELGKISHKAHEDIAHDLINAGIDAIFLVGKEMRAAHRILIEKDINNVHHYGTSSEAISDVKRFVEQGDLVLIKGSRGIKMEYIVRELTEEGAQTL